MCGHGSGLGYNSLVTLEHNLDILLIVLSSLLTIAAVIPYLVEVVRGNTKPRIVSWFTWALLTGIAAAAAFAEGHIATGVLMACVTFEELLIAIVGFVKQGDRKFERLDIICQILALAGLIFWYMFNSPTVAVVAVVTIDAIAAIPTIKHAWQKPYEETWITFVLSAIGGTLTIYVIDEWSITAMAYPIYLVVASLVLAGAILLSPHRKLKGEPAELREL